MDDIRRPGPQRRDFALRDRGYTPRQNVTDLRQPVRAAQTPAPAPPSQPASYIPSSIPQPAPTVPYSSPPLQEQPYTHYISPKPAPAPAAKRRNPLRLLPLKYAAPGAAIIILIAAAGYMLTRPPKTYGFTESQLAKKAGFSFFYPQPMPAGYVYEQKFNAFQDNQAYFMLAKGGKHIIIHEQASSGTLDTSSLTGVRRLDSAAGKAAIGYQAGQPAAKILTGSTLISANSTGPVSQDELTKVLNTLKVTR